MGFLESIQTDLIDEKTSIASTLLKIRLLAAKLGSDDLAEWIQHESEGYPQDAEIPIYRVASISFSGTFHGPFGSGVQNAPIPPLLIKQFVGDEWVTFKIRESAAVVEQMAAKQDGLRLDYSNLMFSLRGKVYPDFEPAEIVGFISHSALIGASNSIRTRLLEITIEIANKIPGANGVELSSIVREPEVVSQIFNQTIHGDMTHIENKGSGTRIHIVINQQDVSSLRDGLVKYGLSEQDSNELAELISAQQPENQSDAGLNLGVRNWLAERITNGVDSGIQGGISVLTKVVQEAAMQFWGI